LSRCFRPEFLNRLDRIIQFRPLSLQVAEQIARREIDLVLQRSGIRRRQLTIDVDPAVVSLLVREGYSPHFGARPLKRTVERLLLLPVARTISNGSLRGRTILRLTARGNRVEATVTGVPAAKAKQDAKGGTPVSKKLTEMLEEYAAIEPSVRPLADRKSELVSRTSEPNFYQDAAARSATFDEIHKLEQFLSLHDGLGKVLTGIRHRLEKTPLAKTEEITLHEKLDQLSSELDHLRFVAQAKDAQDLGDTVITLSLVDRDGAVQNAVPKLTDMYRALAARRRMTAEVLGEFYDDKRDTVHLLIGGLGAYALFKNESGLHQIDYRYKERTPRAGREVIRENRELVRVEARPVRQEPSKQFKQEVKTKVTTLKPARERLQKADLGVSLFHELSLRSIEFWTSGPKQEALDRGFLILHAHSENGASDVNKDSVIRHYDVGLAPKIKDTRTGRTTTRVEQVFKGELGPLLLTHRD